mmetsp:Transcript_6848/g.13853  ORF Transcript_6848/g.13853 Transcript_6848/m.13853 type:complete len:152 (-) Transcript_6848:70-525(-)
MLKLADFDLAMVQLADAMCRSPCGTVPFTAPEVFLQKEYSGMRADIWSLGIVLLEVFCGIRVVEKVLSLGQDAGAGGNRHDNIGVKIRNGFAKPNTAAFVLQSRCRPELLSVLEPAKSLLCGMLTVDVAARWDASRMLMGVRQFPNAQLGN